MVEQLHPGTLLKQGGFFLTQDSSKEALALQNSHIPHLSKSSTGPFTSFLFLFILHLSLALLPSPPPPLALLPPSHEPASNTDHHVTRAGSIRVHLLHVLYNESYITCLLTGQAGCDFCCFFNINTIITTTVPAINSRCCSDTCSSTPWGGINQAVIWSVAAAAINTLACSAFTVACTRPCASFCCSFFFFFSFSLSPWDFFSQPHCLREVPTDSRHDGCLLWKSENTRH